jgi:hypothetical protein
MFEMKEGDEVSRLCLEVAVRRNAGSDWETKVIRWDPRTPDPIVTGAIDVRVIREVIVPWPLPDDHPAPNVADVVDRNVAWYDRRCCVKRPLDFSPAPPPGSPVDGDVFSIVLGEPDFGWLPMRFVCGGQELNFAASNVYPPQPNVACWLRLLCRGVHAMLQIDIEDVFVEFGTAPWPDGRIRLWGAVYNYPDNGHIDLVADPVSIIRKIHEAFSRLELLFDDRDVLIHWCDVDIFEEDNIDDPEIVAERDLVVRRFPDPEVACFLARHTAKR